MSIGIDKELFQVQSYDPRSFRAKHDYIDEGKNLQVLDVILRGVEKQKVRGCGNAVLSGPKGCGKDHLAMQWTIDVEGDMFKTQCFEGMNVMDFIGYPQSVGDQIKWAYGILPAACKHALSRPEKIVVVVIDEANFCSAGVIAVTNPLTDDTRAISIPFTGETIPRPENLKIVLTMNPWEQAGYAGTNQLNIAMLDRFNIIEVDYLSVRSETKLLQKYNDNYELCRKWAEFAAKSREAYKNSEVTNVITTRNLIDYVQYIRVLPEQQVLKLALNQFLTDEREKVEKWWGGIEEIKKKGGESE